MIYALALSPVDKDRMWAGTDDGLIWTTTDGGAHWNNVTPPQMSAWQKVSTLEASHVDPLTAYAAINTLRLDDLRPHIYRTHDGGKTWTEITNGIPENENTDAVREAPGKARGLLFAGTERAVYVSFDDGDHWQSLRQNMPATSIRDLLVKDNDLAVATHGRGFWILDDIMPFAALASQSADAILARDASLFQPAPAWRVRWDTNSDTPLPPDEPAGQNPPDGAIIDYYLKSPVSAPVTLDILDSNKKLVRKFSSADPVPPPDPELAIPSYWLRPPQTLSQQAGVHRFVWDLHYAPVPGIKPEYPISAVNRNTAPAPTSPWVMPGRYTVVLTAGNQKWDAQLTVTMDPRVKTPMPDLQKQFDLSQEVYQDLLAVQPLVEKATAARKQLEAMRKSANAADAARIDAAIHELDSLLGAGRRRRRGPQEQSLPGVRASLQEMLGILQDVDAAPTTQATDAIPKLHQSAASVMQSWHDIESKQLTPLKVQP